MSGTLRLRGATSGYSELQAPAVAADQTFVLPTAGGTLLTTDSPVPKLTLELGSASQPSLTFEGDTDTGLYSSGTNTLNLVTGGSDRLIIDSSGKVGVGSSTPNCQLTNTGTTSLGTNNWPTSTVGRSGGRALVGSDGVLLNWNETAGAGNAAELYLGTATGAGASTMGYARLKGGTENGTNSASFFSVETSNTVGTPSTALYIDSSQRVGIGTTAPSNTLEVAGTATSNLFAVKASSSGDVVAITARSAGNGGIISGLNNAQSDYEPLEINGEIIYFQTRTGAGTVTERARIDSSGRLSLGNTANASMNSAMDNFVLGSGSGNEGMIIYSGSSSSGFIGFNDAAATSTQGVIEYNHSGNHMGFRTADAERMRIDSSGRVGIGTTSPSNFLHIKNDTVANTYAIVENTTAGNAGINLKNANGDWNIVANAELRFIDNAAGDRMRIDSSGRLLVGTTSARTDFFGSLSANVQVEGTSFSAYSCYATNGNGAFIFGRSNAISGSNLGILSWQADDGTDEVEAASISATVDGTPGANDMPGRLVFSTTADGASSPTERMRITSLGYFKASNDSSYAEPTNAVHEFRSNENIFRTLLVQNTNNTSGSGTYNSLLGSNCDNTGSFHFVGNTGAADRVYIYGNGNIVNSNDSYGQMSDIKLKENIVDAESQWDDFKAVRFRKFNFKEETGYETHTQLGVIAQELELVSPGLITETPDLDEDGNNLGTTTKAVKSSVLVKKAMVALQEAMDRIETLEANNLSLENRIAALENN